MSIVSEQVIQNYEAEVAHLTERVGSLAADLLEEQAQRREVAAALVRVTEERDVAQAAYDSLRAASIEHTERHRSIFDEHLRQVAQLTTERDEARDEVVRLGRSLEQALELVAALRVASDRDSAELVRLRTIIGEPGAGEAAEPEEQIEALRPGDAGFDEWLLGQPGGSE